MNDNSKRGRLYFTVGLPRSGKSTYCRQWVLEAVANGRHTEFNAERPRAVISGDAFRTALHGMTYLPEAEGTVFAMMDVAARALLSDGFDVIVDETCTTKATLLRYLRIDIDARPVWIDTPAEVCKQRALDCGKPFLLGPISRMDRQLQTLKANWRPTLALLTEYVRMRLAHDNKC